MAVCAGIKRDGGRCTAVVAGPNDYCYQHDPGRAEERRRNASRAGKSKPARELTDVKRRLSDLADDVLDGKKDKGRAAVAGQLLNALIRAVSVEMKVREVEDLERRLEELEGALEDRGGKRRGA